MVKLPTPSETEEQPVPDDQLRPILNYVADKLLRPWWPGEVRTIEYAGSSDPAKVVAIWEEVKRRLVAADWAVHNEFEYVLTWKVTRPRPLGWAS